MTTAPASSGVRLTEVDTEAIVDEFYREGFALIPGVLTADEVESFKRGIDFVMNNPDYFTPRHQLYGSWIAVRLFETSNIFRDLLVREPLISIAEAVLGRDCHIMAQNAVRNAPGQAIDHFHVDDADPEPEFPCPPGMDQHDPRYRLPVFRMTVQIMLTDCDELQYGPTQFVPRSHYAGRVPDDPHNPTFQGQGPKSILCKAGDIYLHNGQCWHRGAPNTSTRTRYLLQCAYSKRFVAQRFYPFVNYQMPPHVLDGASDRLRRVLGFHGKGPYG